MFIGLCIIAIAEAQVVLQPAKRTPPNTSSNKSSHTQRTENKTTDVVIHQHSRKLLKMDILMFETCWAHSKWNKKASDIKLVFHSTLAMMHGPINIRFKFTYLHILKVVSVHLVGFKSWDHRTYRAMIADRKMCFVLYICRELCVTWVVSLSKSELR